jgi:tetratricopeptide (TPR) repeat protein
MATLQEALAAALDHQEAGRFAKADILYRRILDAAPGHPHALHLWGILAALTGRPDEAAARIGRAIAAAPDIADFHVNLARVEAALNRPGRAARHYAHAVALRPEEAETRFQPAVLLQDLGQAAAARTSFRTVLVLEPGHPGALLRLAATEPGLGRAVEAARIDVALAPGDPVLWNELTNRLKGTGRRAEALAQALAQSVAAYGRGLVLLPGNPVLLNNRADGWLKLDRLERAEEDARAAVTAAPGFAAGWNTLGSILMARGNAGEAVTAYEQAAGIDPANDAQARFNRSIALLTLGRLAEGWGDYEQGWVAPSGRFPRARFPKPLWDGRPLNDGALLVWGEQGLGDEVMFASLIPQLAQDGVRVVLDCDARLAPLLTRGLPNNQLGVTVVARTEPPSGRLTAPDVVAQIPAGSLPRLMRRRIGDFAGRQPPS